MKHDAYRLTALLGLSVLSACGGGGGSSGSSPPPPPTYTVGGSISGLTAPGLVLLDNGGDTLTIAANATSFIFPTALGSGIAYAATIHSQPTGETCTVTNGSGTISSANVSNISVSCSVTPTFTVGGSISGLTASGLVLLDNGGNALTVAANVTSFQFATSVASGTPYAVTVHTQPSGETCSVTDGSGTVTANVTSVSVSCSANSYTIGGSITGLTGSGLVLLDNGGDTLTVATNASTFTFATSLTSGSTYAVTIQTQPTGGTCTVSSGSGTVTNANITSVSVSCTSSFASGGSNVVPVTVEAGPADPGYQTFNIPLVSVTVCQGGHCATIPNVLVDTGSSGLRLMASAVATAGLTLTPMADPNTPGNTFNECLPFAGGYAWGAVATATVTIGGETTSTAIPVQVIDDNTTPVIPNSCSDAGANTSLDSVDAFDANGILGVSTFDQDCGSACDTGAMTVPDIYYSCPSGGCSLSTAPTLLDTQVSNPVASFPTDNNGVILQLPPIAAAGAPTASGYLIFGIGTESNNSLGGATVLTVDDLGNFTTLYTDLNGQAQTLDSSFIDSGSNGLYFPDNSITTCINTPLATQDFYCPTTTLTLSATNQGQNGDTNSASFQIADLADIDENNFAIDDVGGPAPTNPSLGSYFDWGMPFFYGRTVFTAIEGKTVDGNIYANGFYAY